MHATREIRQSPMNMGTPIVAVTAHALKEEQEKLLASGMDDYLSKPIDVESLLTLIKSWCHDIEPGEITFPSMDWQLALKRANQNQAAAKELLNDFIAMLPDTLQTLESQMRKGALDELSAEVHKLHGACCYTGLPRLQNLAKELEIALKLNHTDLIEELLQHLVKEAQKVISENDLTH